MPRKLLAVPFMTRRQKMQLQSKLACGEYDENDAMEIVLWMQDRARGYK
jgi:hypothetical protein